MLVLLTVSVLQMIHASSEEEIALLLYDLGLSETTAQAAGEIAFWGLLIVPSVIVLLSVGALLWTGVSDSEAKFS